MLSFLTTDFEPKANVVLFQRDISGDFDRLAALMAVHYGLEEEEIFIKYSERDEILAFRETLDDDLKPCVDLILNDMEFFYSSGIKTHMRLLTNYKIHQGTYEFHVDGLMQDFDRYMTCYTEPVTQFIRNEDVVQVNGHDVICKPDAEIFGFCVGDIWKSRVRNKAKNSADTFLEKMLRVKEGRAFVHRAQKSDKPRLMVVGDKRV